MESITRMIGIDYMAKNNPQPGGRDRIVMGAGLGAAVDVKGPHSGVTAVRRTQRARASSDVT